MPFEHNAARRHRIPQARYRVRNWPAYEAGLKRRGDLTLWLDEDALTGWQAPRRSTPGGQARYSDAAIEPVLTLRLVFHLALRQAEGFAASVLRLLGQALRVPGHTTLCRRGRGSAGRRPEVVPHDPVHLVADGTGLKLFGRGDVCAEAVARHPEAAVVVPPRAGAVPSEGAKTAPTRRDRHLRFVAERGRMGWQRAAGYGWRAPAGADIARRKRATGDGLPFRTDARQATEVALAAGVLNRCSTSDGRSTSASHDPGRG